MTYHPTISLLLIGGWEVTDRKIDGRIYRVGTPKLEALFRDRLELALRILTAGGARLVMLTTPCLLPASATFMSWVRRNAPDRGACAGSMVSGAASRAGTPP